MSALTIPAAIANAIATLGYECHDPRQHYSENRLDVFVPDTSESEGDAALEALRRALPRWAKANWSGDSSTTSDGDTSSSVTISWTEEAVKRADKRKAKEAKASASYRAAWQAWQSCKA